MKKIYVILIMQILSTVLIMGSNNNQEKIQELKKNQDFKAAQFISENNLSSAGLLLSDQKYIEELMSKNILNQNELEIIISGYKSSAQLHVFMESLNGESKEAALNLEKVINIFKYINNMVAASNIELKYEFSRYGLTLQDYLCEKSRVGKIIQGLLKINFFEIYSGKEMLLLLTSYNVLNLLQELDKAEIEYKNMFTNFMFNHFNKLPQVFFESSVNPVNLTKFITILIKIKDTFENIISALEKDPIIVNNVENNVISQKDNEDESDNIMSMQLPSGTICTIC